MEHANGINMRMWMMVGSVVTQTAIIALIGLSMRILVRIGRKESETFWRYYTDPWE